MKVHYPAKQSVSVWVGEFAEESDFDFCVDSEVAKLLGLDIPIESFCEVTYVQDPVPLRQLIDGFSGWGSFLSQVMTAAQHKGIQSANAALICYYLRCDDAPEYWGKLRFLGNFAGQDVCA